LHKQYQIPAKKTRLFAGAIIGGKRLVALHWFAQVFPYFFPCYSHIICVVLAADYLHIYYSQDLPNRGLEDLFPLKMDYFEGLC